MIAVAVVLGMLGQAAAEDAGAKTAVCHAPPGNPANAHTLQLPEAAIAAHLRHGDVAGECAAPAADAGSRAEGTAAPVRKRGRANVAVCHQPEEGAEGGKARTLRLPAPAVRAHLRHGDTEGPCPGDPSAEGPQPAAQR